MHEYACVVRRVVDGDTLDVDIDLGFYVWMRNVRVRLSDVSAPEANTEAGRQWTDAWRQLIEENGNAFVIKTGKAPKQTLSRWLGALYLADGRSTADILDPQKLRRFKREG